jgi:hypothetical protein
MKLKNKTIQIVVGLFLVFLLYSFSNAVNQTPYKCMIQMKNYTGEGAYVVISLLDAEGEYEETLYVQGDDDEWYFDITEWWNFQGKKRADIDAITGATISGGERKISVIQIPNDKIDKGYKLRFETAVEDKEYYKDDIEFELTTENITKKFEGKGFIRYIRMIAQ